MLQIAEDLLGHSASPYSSPPTVDYLIFLFEGNSLPTRPFKPESTNAVFGCTSLVLRKDELLKAAQHILKFKRDKDFG